MAVPKILKESGLFTAKDLLGRLEKEGFFCNKQSLSDYEATGLIPPAQRKRINNWDWRVYTQEEMNNIIRILRTLPVKKHLNVKPK